jgi:hypothetical protein
LNISSFVTYLIGKLNRFIMTQAAATLMKSWNRSAALHCLIITQLATTMAKSLNRPSRLHQLDKKTSTDFHNAGH